MTRWWEGGKHNRTSTPILARHSGGHVNGLFMWGELKPRRRVGREAEGVWPAAEGQSNQAGRNWERGAGWVARLSLDQVSWSPTL